MPTRPIMTPDSTTDDGHKFRHLAKISSLLPERHLSSYCFENLTLDKNFNGQNISTDKNFDTKPKSRHLCPSKFWGQDRFLTFINLNCYFLCPTLPQTLQVCEFFITFIVHRRGSHFFFKDYISGKSYVRWPGPDYLPMHRSSQ